MTFVQIGVSDWLSGRQKRSIFVKIFKNLLLRNHIEDEAETWHTCLGYYPLQKLWVFLAHLSRRLIGELIVYQWSGVRRPSVRRTSSVVRRCRPQSSNIFFSETAWPIKAKFYVEPPWVGGTKVCSRHLGHMTKMAATSIYGKNPSKIFPRTGRPIFTKLGI